MYLGIDLGDKRVGLAIDINGIAIAKEVVARVEIIKEIKKYIRDYDIKVIVVGLPFDLYNKDFKQLNKTKKFIEKLNSIFPDCKVEGFDERYTTIEAQNIINNIPKNNKKHKDDISAALILESYIGRSEKVLKRKS